MLNPTYYRLHTPDGSLTLRTEDFQELHQTLIDVPRAVFDFQIGNLGRVRRVEWSGNGIDWIPMSPGVIAAEFARAILHWARQPLPVCR